MTDLFAAAAAAARSTATTAVAATVNAANAAINHAETMRTLSAALTTDAAPTVPGMVRPYLAHQSAAHVAANFAIATYGCALLGDDMGMGKTQVLLALAAERIRSGGYAILIAPAVALTGYRSDLAAAFPSLRLAHLYGRTPDFANLPEADLYFLTDDTLTLGAWLTETVTTNRGGKDDKHLQANAFARGAALLSRDEIHRDKGNQGKPTGRARVMLAVGASLREAGIPVVGATGTLLTNRAVEAFLPLQALGGPALVKAVTPNAKAASSFLWYYCAATTSRFGTTFGTNFARMPELHNLLRSTVYVRREKSDLGGMLPHSGWIVKPIGLGGGAMSRYRRIEKQFLDMVLTEKGPEAYWRASRAEALVKMGAMRQEAGKAKAAAALDYVKDLCDQGRSVVLFYVHTAVRDALLDQAVKHKLSYAVIDGTVTGEARTLAIEEFQAGDAQILLAQVSAAGMAVTLTAAADAVFVQCPWSAGELKQCADRILRVDDRTLARAEAGEKITWHVLQAAYDNGDPTFDMALWQVLENKAQVCDAVNAGRPVTMSDESVQYQALMEWLPKARH